MNAESAPASRLELLAEVAGESAGSALLVVIAFASGAVRVQLGAGTMGGAVVGSMALGLGVALVVWSFGRLSGAQTNPFISIVASLLGRQPWRATLRRGVAQVIGASAAALAVVRLLPFAFVRAPEAVMVRPLADGVAAFGFVLVALGIAHRRDVYVPIGLGSFAVASFWMTGHGTIGNPLLATVVLVIGPGEHVVTLDVVRVVGATALGTAIAVLAGKFLFPRVRDAASALLFSPPRAGAPRWRK